MESKVHTLKELAEHFGADDIIKLSVSSEKSGNAVDIKFDLKMLYDLETSTGMDALKFVMQKAISMLLSKGVVNIVQTTTIQHEQLETKDKSTS
jgi:hypothetical protein